MCFFIMLFQCSILKYEFPFFTYKVAFPVSFQLHSNRGGNEDCKSVSLFLNLQEASILLSNGGFI